MTVTVWGVFQLAVLKVKLGLSTLPSAVLSEVMPMLTSAVGWLFRTTVKLAVPSASVVVKPLVGLTVIPLVSLSVLVTATSAALTPL